MKNGEFSDICGSHLKFETAKGGKPKYLAPQPPQNLKGNKQNKNQSNINDDSVMVVNQNTNNNAANTSYAQRNRRNRYLLLANNNDAADGGD